MLRNPRYSSPPPVNISRRHFSQQFGTFFGPFLFDELLRKDDILALLIDLDDLVFVSAAHVRGQTLGGVMSI